MGRGSRTLVGTKNSSLQAAVHTFWVSVSADPAGFICNNLAVLLTRARNGSEPQLCGHGITKEELRE